MKRFNLCHQWNINIFGETLAIWPLIQIWRRKIFCTSMWVTLKEMEIKYWSWDDGDLIGEIMNSEGLGIWFGFIPFHCISNLHHVKKVDILFYTSTTSKNCPEIGKILTVHSFYISNELHIFLVWIVSPSTSVWGVGHSKFCFVKIIFLQGPI